MSTKPDTLAVTNMGTKLADAKVVSSRRGNPVDAGLRRNVLAELKKGKRVVELSRKFGVKAATIYKWRFDEMGPVRKKTKKPSKCVVKVAPREDVPSLAAVSKEVAGGAPYASSRGVHLTVQEARVLCLVVRDAVARMGDSSQETKGKLAVLALKLLG